MGVRRVVNGGARDYWRMVWDNVRVVVAKREPRGCGYWRVHVSADNFQHGRYGELHARDDGRAASFQSILTGGSLCRRSGTPEFYRGIWTLTRRTMRRHRPRASVHLYRAIFGFVRKRA